MFTFNHGCPAALHAEANSVLPGLVQPSETNDVNNSLKWNNVGFRSGLDTSATDILSFQIKAKRCD